MFDAVKSKAEWVRWALLGLLAFFFIYINRPFLSPLVLASIFALGLNEFVNSLGTKLKIGRLPATIITLLAGLALFWLPITLAIYRIAVHVSQPQILETDQVVAQLHHLKDFLVEILANISHWTGIDLAGPARSVIDNVLRRTGEIALSFSSGIVSQLPTILLGSFVFLLALLALLLKAPQIRALVNEYSPFKPETTENLVRVTKGSCSITLFSTLVIGLVQACIVGLGSLIFNEGDFWLILTLTFFVSFIPVIGAAPVGFLLAILAFIGGRTGSGIGMLIVAIIAGSIDNVLKPFMVGKENNINPVVGFTCVVGAIIMMGLPGLLIGPVIMNLFVGIIPILLKE